MIFPRFGPFPPKPFLFVSYRSRNLLKRSGVPLPRSLWIAFSLFFFCHIRGVPLRSPFLLSGDDPVVCEGRSSRNSAPAPLAFVMKSVPPFLYDGHMVIIMKLCVTRQLSPKQRLRPCPSPHDRRDKSIPPPFPLWHGKNFPESSSPLPPPSLFKKTGVFFPPPPK